MVCKLVKDRLAGWCRKSREKSKNCCSLTFIDVASNWVVFGYSRKESIMFFDYATQADRASSL